MPIAIANSPLKSVQGGVATILSGNTFVDVTISSVTAAKSAVLLTPQGASGASGVYTYDNISAKGELTSGTNLRLSRPGSGAVALLVGWQVVEHN